jgi:glycosyltransferase involved in cell wall biosynthesis
MKKEITFILPTRNRKKWVTRAIDSCLNCEDDIIKPYIIVIDGESEDGTYDYLREVYRHNHRVQILRNNYSFMDACFYGVKLIKTELSTFMYDDDILSMYFKQMITHMSDHGKNFVMGYGQVSNIEKVYPFKTIDDFMHYPNSQFLLGYYGYRTLIEYTFLPVSPICCVVKTDLLKEWVEQVKAFAEKTNMRKYFMLKKNIGPDLMIYLLSLLTNKDEVCVASATVAQFSVHSTSMTVSYEKYMNTDLAIGYWLAKVWAFEHLLKIDKKKESAQCASYLLLSGIIILLRKIRNGKLKWSLSIIKEIFSIKFKILKYMICINVFTGAPSLIRENIRRKERDTFPS